MKVYEILFIAGAILATIGLIPACIDAVKTLKDVIYDFKENKTFLFETIMFIIAIICFIIGIIIMIIMKVYNGWKHKMFVYKTGNILRSKAEYIFNAVNTVGIMGKGLALQIKQKYPDCLKDYEEACRDKRLKPGSVLITYLVKEKINIVQFPTKVHWRDPSKYEYIEEGLKSFAIFLKNHNIQNVTIAIPKLGCGNGKLEWKQVLTLIKQYLSEFDDIVFEIYGEDV